MTNIQRQIQRKKDAIALKKRILQKQMHHSKEHLSSSLLFDASVVGGLILGYLILPKRFSRLLFKSVSLFSTINAVKDMVQTQLLPSVKPKSETRRKRK